MDEANGDAKLMAKKRALETVSLSHDVEDQPTVVSSADGANVLKELESTIEKYKNISNRINTFIGDVAKALGATRKGSKSEYATFETVNGKIVTIRLADHNATVSNFDNRGELDGISIVVSPKRNEGITNDGKAHIVEYYYDAIKLRRAEGKPLADIVRSIQQALYSGEFKDTTGLAERQEVNEDNIRFFRTADGNAYGFTVNGKVYIDPRMVNADTPIHEYTHLWATVLRERKPKEWKNVVELMKGTDVWDEVVRTYPELKTDDEIADEVLAQYSGRRGAERLRREMDDVLKSNSGITEKAAAVMAINNVRAALNRFWRSVARMLGLRYTSAEDVADCVLRDMLNREKPGEMKPNWQKPNSRIDLNDEKHDTEKHYRQWVGETRLNRAKKYLDAFLEYPTEKYRTVFPTPTTDDYFLSTRTDFKTVPTDDVNGTWEEMKNSGKYEHKKSPLSNSEYLVDHETGDIYRMSDHWGPTASCYWALDGNFGRQRTEMRIAKSNIKDFGVWHTEREKDVEIDMPLREYAQEVEQSITNYRDVLANVPMTDGHRARFERGLAMLEDVQRRLEEGGYKPKKDDLRYASNSEEAEIVARAKADGTYMKAPNGKKSNLTPRQWVQVRTKAFKKWFGDWENDKENSSKVVDENGEPLVVYHGTLAKELTKFDPEMVGSRYSYDEKGFFFTSSRNIAHDYASSEFDSSRKGKVIDTFISLRNPLIVDSKWCLKNGLGRDVFKNNDAIEFWDNYQSLLLDESEGNDGIIIDDGTTRMVVAFEPTQIKSATENIGTFDPNNPDIRYQKDGENGASYSPSDMTLEEVNERFNEELGGLTEENAQSVILNIGRPGMILRSSGISDMPIRLYGNKLMKKIRKHGFEASDVKDLPMAINNPIAVFNNYGNERNRAVLTELITSQGNILVSLEWGKGSDAEINIVTSVFGKGKSNIVDWINNGFATYINKEKALGYLRISALIAEAQDSQRLNSAAKVVEDFENPKLPEEKNENISSEASESTEDYDLYRTVEDEDTIEFLEGQPSVTTYRSMALIDGNLYPPMSSKEMGSKKLRNPSELGKWEEAEESPDKAYKKGDGWYYDLKKDNGKTTGGVAYNPYIHTSTTMLNDQFSEAQSRDNLVVVEMEVPQSELTSGYKAEKAKDSVGAKEWKAGIIQGMLSGTREVILTRWAKPVRMLFAYK